MKGASFSKRVFKSVAHKTQNLAAAATAAKAKAASAEATTSSTTVRSHVGSSFLGGMPRRVSHVLFPRRLATPGRSSWFRELSIQSRQGGGFHPDTWTWHSLHTFVWVPRKQRWRRCMLWNSWDLVTGGPPRRGILIFWRLRGGGQ